MHVDLCIVGASAAAAANNDNICQLARLTMAAKKGPTVIAQNAREPSQSDPPEVGPWRTEPVAVAPSKVAPTCRVGRAAPTTILLVRAREQNLKRFRRIGGVVVWLCVVMSGFILLATTGWHRRGQLS